MNGYEFSIVWHSVWRLLVMDSQGRKTWWPGFPIGHHLSAFGLPGAFTNIMPEGDPSLGGYQC